MQHKKQFEPLLAHKQKQLITHKDERSKQDALQQSRWQLKEIIELRGGQLEERQALVKEMSHLKGLDQSQDLNERERHQERNKDQGFEYEP